jgi:hypothetical protein
MDARSHAGAPREVVSTSWIERKPFLEAAVGGKHVLMSVEHGIYIGLDDVGKRIWDCLAAPQTIATLCNELGKEYLVGDQPTFERDVVDFVASLRLHGLVQVIE